MPLEHTLWHPVMVEGQLTHAPLPVTLLGQRLVLWRDAQNHPHAWADRCPHRGARLSLGAVVAVACGTRRLACPYHGWAFDAGGQCVHVPAQPDWTPPTTHAVQTHEVRAAHGLLWVRLESPSADTALPPALQHPPEFAPGTDAAWRQVVCGPYAVATSAGRLVENFLDMSHFSFVHRGWLGDADHPQVDVGRVEETASGITVDHARAWQPKAYASATDGQMVDYRYDVLAPWAATLLKEATTPDGPRNAIALFINPVGEQECVAWFVMATQNDPTPDGDLQRFQDAVFAQDRPVVESQTPRRLPIRPVPPALPVQSAAQDCSATSAHDLHHVREVHGPADRLSAAYRRYLNRLGVGFGVC